MPLVSVSSSRKVAGSVTLRSRLLGIGSVLFLSISLLHAADPISTKLFDIPADAAARSLKRFSEQASLQVIFPSQVASGIRTHAIQGEMTPRDALERMLANTGLVLIQDAETGAFSVRKETAEDRHLRQRSAPSNRSDESVKKNGNQTRETKEPMKRNRLLTRLVATLGLLTAPADAQTAPTSSSSGSTTTESNYEAIELSPFVVNADQDVGYQAANTLAGSRLNTSLKDTAASLSVMTAEFLSDIGATDLEDAMMWSTNSQLDAQDHLALGNNNSDDNGTFEFFGRFRVRGLPATVTTNYFPRRLPVDTYNIERVEEARGPNSILFGIGAAGGVVNTTTKRPLFGRDNRSGSLQFNNYGGYRGAIDLNKHAGEKLAVRFNAVYSHLDQFRRYTYKENRRVHLAVAYNLRPTTRIRAEYETGIIKQVVAANNHIRENFSRWVAAESPVLSAPIPANQNSAHGVGRLGSATQVYYIGNTNSLYNMAGQYRSSGQDAATGSSVADYSVNPGGPGALRRGDFDALSVFFEQQFGKATFLELAYNHQEDKSKAFQPAGDTARLYIDPNAFLPTGEPNPHAGQFMFEGQTWGWIKDNESDNFRASLSTELDYDKWGKYRLAGMVEREERSIISGNFVEVWEGAPFHPHPDNAANIVRRRNYVTPGDWNSYYRSMPAAQGFIQGMTDPVTGETLSSTLVPRNVGQRDNPEDQDTVLVAAQARFFKDRLVLGLGHRWDTLDVTTNFASRDPVTNVWGTDYSNPTHNTYKGRTRTLGVVGHLTKNISVFYNNSDNFSLPPTNRILPDSQRAGNPESTGEDVGLAFDLFDGRLFARASYYRVDMVGGASSIYGGTLTNPTSISNIILNTLVDEGLLTDAQADARRTDTNGGTFDRLVEGYELNLTSNPTKNWRLQANFSFTDGYTSQIAPEVKDWVADYIPFYEDFDQELVTGHPNALTIGEVIGRFMEYHNNQLAAEGLVLPGNRKYKVNLFTSYNFSEGRLKGLTIGGGYLHQSKLPVGLTPEGGLRYANSYWDTNAMIGYRFAKVRWLKRLHFQLNVSNLFNETQPYVYRYQGNTDVIRIIRVRDPRSWKLTANFAF